MRVRNGGGDSDNFPIALENYKFSDSLLILLKQFQSVDVNLNLTVTGTLSEVVKSKMFAGSLDNQNIFRFHHQQFKSEHGRLQGVPHKQGGGLQAVQGEAGEEGPYSGQGY